MDWEILLENAKYECRTKCGEPGPHNCQCVNGQTVEALDAYLRYWEDELVICKCGQIVKRHLFPLKDVIRYCPYCGEKLKW